MPKFALKYPYFILMICLVVALVGSFNVASMPVDLFPSIDMPVVVVATFYNGMPPQQIEADITNTFERFFTLAANVDHSESRSLTGVSLIKVYFKPGTDPNVAVGNIANLAMADLRRLPPGTLPPVVLGMDASTQPVCLVTLKGQGLNETNLKDLAQFQVRNQISNVQGASVPQPYGGTYRQIQIYVDHWPRAHRRDDPDISRQPAGHSRGAAGSAALHGCMSHDHELHERIHQHHGAWRAGARLFSSYR
jgi:multidrug efflux pump subunit AcrB